MTDPAADLATLRSHTPAEKVREELRALAAPQEPQP